MIGGIVTGNAFGRAVVEAGKAKRRFISPLDASAPMQGYENEENEVDCNESSEENVSSPHKNEFHAFLSRMF